MSRAAWGWALVAVLGVGVAYPAQGRAENEPTYEEVMEKAKASAAFGEWDAAAKVLEPASARFPKDLPLQLMLAQSRLRSGKLADAAAAYRKALEIDANSGEAKLGLADALIASSSWSDARPVTAELAEKTPSLETHKRHALVLRKLGEHAEAEAAYRKVQESAPADVDAALGLGWVYLEQEKKDEARAQFEAVLAREPGNSEALEGKSRTVSATPLDVSAAGLYQTASGTKKSAQWGVGAAVGTALGPVGVSVNFRHLSQLGGTSSSSGQNEGYLTVRPNHLGSLALFGGYAAAGKGTGPFTRKSAWSAGLKTGLLDRRLDFAAVASGYDDGIVGQGELALRLDLTGSLSAQIGGRVQYVKSGFQPAGTLELSYYRFGFALGVLGEYGSQRRMFDVDGMELHNMAEELEARAGAYLEKGIGTAGNLRLAYDLQVFNTQVHRVTVGFSRNFRLGD